jgi:cell division protein FtsB
VFEEILKQLSEENARLRMRVAQLEEENAKLRESLNKASLLLDKANPTRD